MTAERAAAAAAPPTAELLASGLHALDRGLARTCAVWAATRAVRPSRSSVAASSRCGSAPIEARRLPRHSIADQRVGKANWWRPGGCRKCASGPCGKCHLCPHRRLPGALCCGHRGDQLQGRATGLQAGSQEPCRRAPVQRPPPQRRGPAAGSGSQQRPAAAGWRAGGWRRGRRSKRPIAVSLRRLWALPRGAHGQCAS